MKISYAITVCNEEREVAMLINFLLIHKREQDEIVVLADSTKMPQTLQELLRACASVNQILLIESDFKGHFADWKNLLTSHCTGDFIFQIDADEIPNKFLIEMLPELLEINQDVEVFRVPRINTVVGLTDEHVQKWQWNVNANGWINFPDYQWRIYRNDPNIKWKNKVHEVLDGFKTISVLPDQEYCSLYHPKTIERQEKQNNYYNTL
jgi:hypothetical protein